MSKLNLKWIEGTSVVFFVKLALSLLMVTFCSLLMVREFGPKYEFIKGDDGYPGAAVYRFNKFTGGFERCFINKHRSEALYKKFDKYNTGETIMCFKSYEIIQKELDKDIQEQIEQIEKLQKK